MDIERIIEELRAERDRLEGIIIALERLHGTDESVAAPKRRGRKFMDKQGRKEVSERMKRYWASRRTRTATKELADGASASGDTGETSKDPEPSDRTHVIAA